MTGLQNPRQIGQSWPHRSSPQTKEFLISSGFEDGRLNIPSHGQSLFSAHVLVVLSLVSADAVLLARYG
jgi:hypothetical protein